MSMSKQDFIALANNISNAKGTKDEFTPSQLKIIATFCRGQNPAFMEGRWLNYIDGKCGPRGGKV